VLYTRGGDTEVPWRLISLMREFAPHIGVLIPFRASSSGTLIAMGANEIVMTPLSVLGPTDPSRTHPLLPRPSGGDPEPVSVQDMRHAMQFIREAPGSDKEMPYTPEAMAQIFTALFDKIHPLAIGAIEQSYALSKLVGSRCLATHMTADDDAPKIARIVDTLCDDFKSHAYQINRKEARDIGLNVVDASPKLESSLLDLYKLYSGRPIFPAGPPVPGRHAAPAAAHLAWLDSTGLNMRVEGTFAPDQNGNLSPQGDAWTSYRSSRALV
jgi:hypothetical protein